MFLIAVLGDGLALPVRSSFSAILVVASGTQQTGASLGFPDGVSQYVHHFIDLALRHDQRRRQGYNIPCLPYKQPLFVTF